MPRPRNSIVACLFPNFARSFREALLQRGLSSKDAAALFGIHHSMIYRYEGGKSRPSTGNVRKFELLLKSTFDMSDPEPGAIRSTLQTLVERINALGFSVELRPLAG